MEILSVFNFFSTADSVISQMRRSCALLKTAVYQLAIGKQLFIGSEAMDVIIVEPVKTRFLCADGEGAELFRTVLSAAVGGNEGKSEKGGIGLEIPFTKGTWTESGFYPHPLHRQRYSLLPAESWTDPFPPRSTPVSDGRKAAAEGVSTRGAF